jgi:hypothetical protein
MLEDDSDRLYRFAAAVRAIDPNLPLLTWRSAHRMIAEVAPLLPHARLISLDHDLDPWDNDPPDPGDGVAVAKFLAMHPQPCPVIIHTSNGTRSDWMAGEFELAGWSYRRVAPIGEGWIEEYWRVVARELLGPPGRRAAVR